MNKRKLFSYLLIALSLPYFSSCEDEKDEETIQLNNGVIVLNQGKMNNNNASMSYYNYANSQNTDFFPLVNNRVMGDGGQDILQYGSKIYIAMSGSSTIEVVNPKTGKSKSISITDPLNAPGKPRSLTCANGKVFAVYYSGYVAQIDTITLKVEKTVKVGTFPDGSVIANNKLYVSNTGAGTENTLSVINLQSFTEEKKIEVNMNPYGFIDADSQGDVYVQSAGDYVSIPAKFQRVEAATGNVTDINIAMNGFCVYNDTAYIFSYENENWQAAAGSVKISVYDLKNEVLVNENIITSTDVEKTPMGIAVNPYNNDIYLSTSDYVTMGTVYCFSKTGTKKFSFTAGVNPAKFLFLK